jgi:hypothetical protein
MLMSASVLGVLASVELGVRGSLACGRTNGRKARGLRRDGAMIRQMNTTTSRL